ncbi:MAG: capsule assembly Wzi family protein [Chloroherpetonaceae bacterium]|nr:capsule assembly Wzi family protein [Chloroherpetonaceae bacterium]MDW8437713.1 capsule assembly Wzi family protein [Chloroherpetonaceae bacterium]
MSSRLQRGVFCILLASLATSALAQSLSTVQQGGAYLELNHWIYDFLQRQYVKGNLTQVFLDARPVARAELAKYVAELAEKRHLLNPVEREQVNFCLREFSDELRRIGLAQLPAPDAFYKTEIERVLSPIESLAPRFAFENGRNLLAVESEEFTANFDFIAGSTFRRGGLDSSDFQREDRLTNGAVVWGRIGERVDYYINIRDNALRTNAAFPGEVFALPRYGFALSRQFGFAYHDEAVAYLKVSTNHFEIAYGKLSNQWGAGLTGSLVLSDYATSYNQLLLRLKIWKLKYSSAFAELIDYALQPNLSVPQNKKYFAAHRLDIQFHPNINFGLFESVIIAGRGFDVGYLNPIMFYRSMEHYYGSPDNAAIGADFNWRVVPSLALYGQMFIDDLTTGKIGTGFWGNKFAYLAGLYVVDPFRVQNIDFRIEYARVDPYTYTRSATRPQDNATAYLHYGTPLGYFSPPNSDYLFLEARCRFTKQLIASVSYSRYRHGANPDSLTNVGGDILLSRRPNLDSEFVKFLDGALGVRDEYRASVSFEVIRNLFLNAWASYQNSRNFLVHARNRRENFSGWIWFVGTQWNI